ncbi:hypothetical protein LCGC14_1181480 [marine sediment metagenome]|uniref:Ubiquitin-activating enzyme E1 FCCH domain-containing protein n=1 Tax=marine sediment metagenome TaxID=412755 RepID=A0A0F9LRT7_9ZZZZ
MPRLHRLTTNFAAGEWSPLMEAQTDQEQYRNAVKKLENFITLPQGGIRRRPGSHFVAEVKDSTKKIRLIKFEFSVTQAYTIEMGNLYMRFFANSGILIEATTAITGAVDNGSGLIRVTATGHGLSTGDPVAIAGVGGTHEANGNWVVTVIDANTLDLDGSTFTNTYTSGGTVGKIVEVVTPYLEADLFQIQFVQSADVLYLAHPSYAPRTLSRVSATSFTLAVINFWKVNFPAGIGYDGPYLEEKDDLTITPSATTGTVTLTASAAFFDDPGHIGALVRLKHGATWGAARITAVASSTSATADVIRVFGATTASDTYQEGAWSDFRGYPGAVSFYEGRLYWAGSTFRPQTFWGSAVGNFVDHTPSVTDGDAIDFTIDANEVNIIRWMVAGKFLVMGTARNNFNVQGGSDTPIEPTNIRVKQGSGHGTAILPAVRVGGVILFVSWSGRKLHELVFDFDTDEFVAPDLTLTAEHITLGGITNIAFQRELNNTYWAVRGDGVLLALAYLREQKIVSWSRQLFTNGIVESVAVIPHPNGDREQTWLSIKRTIGGATKRYVEYLDDVGGFYNELGPDSALVYDGAATATLTGLHHLEGETVDILGDGSVYTQQVVTNGEVTGLDPTVVKAEVGLPFTSKGKTFRPEVTRGGGETIQGVPIADASIIMRVDNTLGLKIANTVVDFPTNLDSSPVKFTGDIKVSRLGWDDLGELTFEQSKPLPATILGIIRTLEIGNP